MNPKRSIEILGKLKTIHERNPHLAMSDITNEEIIEALDIAVEAEKCLIDLAKEALDALEEAEKEEKLGKRNT